MYCWIFLAMMWSYQFIHPLIFSFLLLYSSSFCGFVQTKLVKFSVPGSLDSASFMSKCKLMDDCSNYFRRSNSCVQEQLWIIILYNLVSLCTECKHTLQFSSAYDLHKINTHILMREICTIQCSMLTMACKDLVYVLLLLERVHLNDEKVGVNNFEWWSDFPMSVFFYFRQTSLISMEAHG